MRAVKIVFRVVGALVLLAMIGVGVGGTYLEHNPEKAAAYALGSMNVDPQAGYLEQGRQMIAGFISAQDAVEDLRGLESASFAVRKPRDVAEEEGWGAGQKLMEERSEPSGEEVAAE